MLVRFVLYILFRFSKLTEAPSTRTRVKSKSRTYFQAVTPSVTAWGKRPDKPCKYENHGQV